MYKYLQISDTVANNIFLALYGIIITVINWTVLSSDSIREPETEFYLESVCPLECTGGRRQV